MAEDKRVKAFVYAMVGGEEMRNYIDMNWWLEFPTRSLAKILTAYHHNLASFKERRILSVEVTPDTHDIFVPNGLYFHTNHLILEKTKAFPQEKNYVQTSSMSRFSVISSEINRLSNPKNVLEKDVLDILSSHRKAPYSPCRHPKGNVQGITLGTAIIDVMKGTMRIYKGNPCIAREKGWVREYCF